MDRAGKIVEVTGWKTDLAKWDMSPGQWSEGDRN